MWRIAALGAGVRGTAKPCAGRRALIAAWALLAASGAPWLSAQLVLENPQQRWQPGATVELVLRDKDIRQTSQIDAVLLDDRPIPFEVVAPKLASDPIRIRIRVPEDIGRGAHQLTVLSSDAAVGVPRIVGLTLEEARRVLSERGLGLDTGTFSPSASEEAVHSVTRQSPAAGARVRPGRRIAVASRTEVPEIRNLTLDEARRELEPRGLELVASEGPPAAVVGAQDPAAGTAVPPGTLILVETAVPIPNLVGRRIDEARESLLEIGLVPRVVVREAADGPFETVLTQQPAAGGLAAAGSGITVAIESLPDPPPPSWPWPWAAATAALATGLGARVRARQVLRRSLRVEVHNDLDRLLESATPPAWEDRELGLDIRLSGHPDPGRQTLVLDGPLVVEPGR